MLYAQNVSNTDIDFMDAAYLKWGDFPHSSNGRKRGGEPPNYFF